MLILRKDLEETLEAPCNTILTFISKNNFLLRLSLAFILLDNVNAEFFAKFNHNLAGNKD